MASLRSAASFSRLLATVAVAVVALSHASTVSAQDCTSSNPADWPAPAKPYFMVAFDTSGSMTSTVGSNNSCGYPNNRVGHGRCAMLNTFQAFSGQASFGLASFARQVNNCNPTCYSGCTYSNFPGNSGNAGCGPEPNANGDSSTRAGANILVPLLSDLTVPYPPGGNTADLLTWVDNDCTASEELFASGNTPLNGILRDMYRYLSNQWTQPGGGVTYVSPLLDPGSGEMACRSVNVILVTDGGETCDSNANAIDAAADLLTGFTKDSINWSVRTYVIDFGNTGALADQIAAAGGTGAAQSATDEVSLSIALANVIATAMQPEVCDNTDNNCNGCIDEGYKHYCNVQQTCCSWSTPAQRDACIATYEASIPGNPPDGDLTLLPCITQAQQQDEDLWLCYDPGDQCDDADNNCQNGVDEGQLKCGNPPHCPSAEVCNGEDDDCDNQIDEGGVCGSCFPTSEICDGCDNDCDGIIDNGSFPDLVCGLPSPPNCDGTMSCNAPHVAPGGPGTCDGGGYGACSNNPQPDVCDGVDNDCNGLIDDGFVSADCEPPSNPPGLVYTDTDPNSACVKGATQCIGGTVQCVGGTGPSAEVCDGIDNDCDGFVDSADPGGVFGVGIQCGINNPPCAPGLTACVAGSLVCQGGIPPQPEVCDGADNDCDGGVDEAPLADAPLPGQQGCWNLPGNCCTHGSLSWCPPPGASCYDNGALGAPCNKGTLSCSAGSWTCLGPVQPSPEVCDGVDNDCVNGADDGNPGGGGICGTNVGICQEGSYQCVNGSLNCVGEIPPQPETCNNLDDDCDGTTDDNVPNGGPCAPSYDPVQFPDSNPALLPCQQGVLVCDGQGNFVCQGGVGPTAEVCDGVDNDCDGNIDESGPAPNGIDGTANPLPPPNASIGDACGNDVGVCDPGAYACLNGLFACLGGSGPVIETCNCLDDDCDGSADELPGPNEPVLCSPGKDCVKGADFCQCAEPCGGGEYPCPPGQICQTLENSAGTTGAYCVTDFTAQCGDCSTKTTTDGNGDVVCAPAGTVDDPGCLETPECVCKGQPGCREPCFNVTCSSPQVCSNFGPTPGECVDDSCYFTGCSGCNRACHAGVCSDNPCLPDSCPGETAKPSDDWLSCDCVPSCAGVDCGPAEKCQDGVCIDWCPNPCGNGQVCDPAILECVDSACTVDSCPGGEWCNPINGQCGDDPCTGVVCPDGQRCEDGSCYDDGGGGTGGGGTGGGGGSGGGISTGGGTTSSSGQGGANDGAFGMPTGGGGCVCNLGEPARDSRHAWLALVGLALALSRRRGSRGEGRDR